MSYKYSPGVLQKSGKTLMLLISVYHKACKIAFENNKFTMFWKFLQKTEVLGKISENMDTHIFSTLFRKVILGEARI